MTVDEFRTLALTFPKAIEKPHFNRASFRVDVSRGKVFATLLETEATANIFLSVEEQEILIASEPSIFSKVPNKWGDKGATTIALANSDEITTRSALKMSWRRAAPESLEDLV